MMKYMNAVKRRLNLPREVRERVMADLDSSIRSRREAGQTDEEMAYIAKAAESIPVFKSANMSVGVALVKKLVKEVAAKFGTCDIEIVEAHHNRKVDAPSGTAILLTEAMAAAISCAASASLRIFDRTFFMLTCSFFNGLTGF